MVDLLYPTESGVAVVEHHLAMATIMQTLIPVHVGLRQPSVAPPVLGAGACGPGRRTAPSRDMPLLEAAFDWEAHGVMLRWLGMESGDCPAAIEPHNFHQHGAEELERFFVGSAERGETAVLISVMGNVNDERPRPLMAQGDATVSIAGTDEYVLGARTPRGSAVTLAPAVTGAERDLGLRLLSRGTQAPWWGMTLHGSQFATGMGVSPPAQITGTLRPVLLDAAGAAVVAVWVSPSGDRRWYVVPDQCNWGSILDWLTAQALPEYAPATLRRLRSPHLRDPELRTATETEALAGLDALQQDYERHRARLQHDLDAARSVADPVRDGLLYGTSKVLERAVAGVLTDAGITVSDLDALLGDTSSADLLVERNGRRRLIEVKSASGNAPEKLMTQLENHLRNWPSAGQDPVEGGLLVVNHQHREPPAERAAAVYERADFVRNVTAPVISTQELFDWWRASEWDQIRETVFPPTAMTPPAASTPAAPSTAPPAFRKAKRRPWRRRG
jgi:hypothetical protein